MLAGTSGGFLYIATVSMTPQILNRDDQGTESSLQLVLELVSFLLGITMMIIVSAFEESHH